MSYTEPPSSRIPTLVQYCQRGEAPYRQLRAAITYDDVVASNHVDAISSLGDDLRYDLIKPILESCNAETLLRLEQASPHIQQDTPDIWKDMCLRSYPLVAEQCLSPELDWKEHYFVLREAEAQRLEEIGSRIRNQRLKADGEKKEREVKFTDRIPPPKRNRSGWSTTPQPKTLFQKTRSEASRIQKNVYSRVISKDYRVLRNTLSAKPPPAPSSSPSNVTVNTVIYRRPSANPSYSSMTMPTPESAFSQSLPSTGPADNPGQDITRASIPSDPRLPKLPAATKKDPMAALFMPKHRAHSQLPSNTNTQSPSR